MTSGARREPAAEDDPGAWSDVVLRAKASRLRAVLARADADACVMRARSALAAAGEQRSRREQELRRTTSLPERAPLPARALREFDWIARRAAGEVLVPVALVSLVDVRGQSMPGQFGLPEPWATRRSVRREHSLCSHVVTASGPLVIPDTAAHPLLAGHPAVRQFGVAACAGVPLTALGRSWGALSAVDVVPRDWTEDDIATLTGLAELAGQELSHRLTA